MLQAPLPKDQRAQVGIASTVHELVATLLFWSLVRPEYPYPQVNQASGRGIRTAPCYRVVWGPRGGTKALNLRLVDAQLLLGTIVRGDLLQ
eukprot:11124495-Alexandrium_andersonii.AAC.1